MKIFEQTWSDFLERPDAWDRDVAPPVRRPGALLGRWRLDPDHSLLDLSGPGREVRSAELYVTKDDGEGLAWTLVHEDGQGVLSMEVADAPIDGAVSRAIIDGRFATLRLRLEAADSIAVMVGPKAAPLRMQRLKLIAPETLVVHDVFSRASPFRGETLVFARASNYPRDVS